MANLKDLFFDDSKVELEYKLSISEFYSEHAEWICVTLTFRSKKLPDIIIESHGQEISDVEELIKDLKNIASDTLPAIDFTPLEPDYTLEIIHSGRGKFEKEDLYYVKASIDAGGANGGVYVGTGPALELCANRHDLNKFANEIEKELNHVRIEYNLEKGKKIVDSVKYKE